LNNEENGVLWNLGLASSSFENIYWRIKYI
jgi:hypothetical protein